MNGDLFAAFEHARHPTLEPITPGAVWLRAFADEHADQLMQALAAVLRQAPLRQMQTPGGYTMSVASSNCGALGWVSDRRGYRYQAIDPLSEQPWPALPALFVALATRAAAAAGFAGFVPDACLINRYVPGARMSLHQDKNERDMTQPIVSVSLGLPATFRFGGDQRSDKTVRLQLESGDVVVWGGPARWRFHGVDAVPEGMHQLTGHCRFNLTMRKAG
jgi:alkylated DNA repair protein (DNA oxidative demethylase)